MNLFRNPRKKPDPAIRHNSPGPDLAAFAVLESRIASLERENAALCERLAWSDDSLEAVQVHAASLEVQNAGLSQRLTLAEKILECQAIEHAEIKERLAKLEQIDLTPFISAITDTGADQSELAAKVETLLANQKALGDRLTVQTAIISNAELGVAALRDTDQLARETLGSVRQEWSARCDRLQALENTFAKFRSERDTRFRDAARVLSGETCVIGKLTDGETTA